MKVLSRRSGLGATATLVNFPVVFAGLIAITTQSSGNDEIALLNLWAAWGILLGLLGQVGLISGVLDLKRWNEPTVLMAGGAAAAIAGAVSFALRNRLFPDHETWWIAVVVIAAAVFVIGRLRGALTISRDAVATLLAAALENIVRSIAIALVVFSGSFELGAPAIVAPFALSVFVLIRRISRRPAGLWAHDQGAFDSISKGLLAGVPALVAYAVVPGLTLLDATDNLDRIAVAASLLRGPLLITTFVAPWILERSFDSVRLPTSIARLLPAFVLIVQFPVGLLLTDGTTGELFVQTMFSGLVAASTYLCVLWNAEGLPSGWWPTATIALSLAIFVVVLTVSTRTDLMHPFVALSAACSVVPIAIRS